MEHPNRYRLRRAVALAAFVLAALPGSPARAHPPDAPLGFVLDADAGEPDTALARVYEAFRLARLDEALALSDGLAARRPLASRAGLRNRLAAVRVLEVRQRLPEALERLVALIDDLEAHPHPDLLASALLLRELIHEHLGAERPAREALAAAGALVRRHGLPEVRPSYLVRAASFHRLLGSRARARAYADSALAAARAVGATYDEVDAYFLRAALLPRDSFDRRADLLHRAARGGLVTGDIAGHAYTLLNLAHLERERGRTGAALAYTDSVLAFRDVAERAGYADGRYLALAYRLRSELFAGAGAPDSAYANLALAAALELAAARASSAEEVLRVEREYEASRQAAALAAERSRRWLLTYAAAALAALAGVLALYVVRLARARRRVAAEVERQTALRGELQHRVKNNLQILISLLEVRAERSVDAETADAFAAMARRVHGLAAVHELLDPHDGDGHVGARGYVEGVVAGLTPPNGADGELDVRVAVEEVDLPARTLLPVGLLLNELLTNSLKHVARPLRIAIGLSREGGTFALTYDDGGGFLPPPSSARAGGLGLYLVETMVRQLRGALDRGPGGALAIRFRADGSRVPPLEGRPRTAAPQPAVAS